MYVCIISQLDMGDYGIDIGSVCVWDGIQKLYYYCCIFKIIMRDFILFYLSREYAR